MQSRFQGLRRSMLALAVGAATVAGVLAGVAAPPADALVTAVNGGAYGYYVNVGLFGGRGR